MTDASHTVRGREGQLNVTFLLLTVYLRDSTKLIKQFFVRFNWFIFNDNKNEIDKKFRGESWVGNRHIFLSVGYFPHW